MCVSISFSKVVQRIIEHRFLKKSLFKESCPSIHPHLTTFALYN